MCRQNHGTTQLAFLPVEQLVPHNILELLLVPLLVSNSIPVLQRLQFPQRWKDRRRRSTISCASLRITRLNHLKKDYVDCRVTKNSQTQRKDSQTESHWKNCINAYSFYILKILLLLLSQERSCSLHHSLPNCHSSGQ